MNSATMTASMEGEPVEATDLKRWLASTAKPSATPRTLNLRGVGGGVTRGLRIRQRELRDKVRNGIKPGRYPVFYPSGTPAWEACLRSKPGETLEALGG